MSALIPIPLFDKTSTTDPSCALSELVLAWYNLNHRTLPWRAPPGQTPNPYYVWLSEMMLQQTTVPTVIPYFRGFIKRWPNFKALAEASLDDILHAWQGLGYYARAKNLYRTAQLINDTFKGILPSDPAALESLPGIGPYTARAIAAIAFNKTTSPVDGNIIRLFSRIYAVPKPLPDSLPIIQDLALHHTPQSRCGDYIQGLMDLGSLICRPTSPSCSLCPLKSMCEGFKEGNPQSYPMRRPKLPKPLRSLNAYWIENSMGHVLLEKRPLKGLLGGMILVPTSSWDNSGDLPSPLISLLKNCTLTLNTTPVTHVFTHFKLHVSIYCGIITQKNISSDLHDPSSYFWCPRESFDLQAFPSLMKKITHAVKKNHKRLIPIKDPLAEAAPQ